MYVYGKCVINVLTYSWIKSPMFTSFAQHPPASLCSSWPIFSSEELCTPVSGTCMHHGAIRCYYLISLRSKINHGVSLWNISVCFDYNIQVLWLTSNRCWADVGGRHQPNVEATLGRHCAADIDPTSVKRRPNTCSLVVFSSLYNLPELLCAEIVPILEEVINSGPVLAWLQTYCKLTWNLNGRHFFRAPFSNAFSWIKVYINFD